MDTAQWPQGIGVVRAVENSRPTEKKPRPQKEQALNCPRCNSTNTKFCYYNNYSLSQPRYFCKTCRRYWTEGGNLRNVPVGGGSRKNRRSSSSSISSASSKKVLPDLSPPKFSPQNPKIHEGQDLNLAYNPPIYNGISEFGALPFGLDIRNLNPQNPNNSSSNISSHLPVMELLKTGNISSGGLSSLISMPVSNSNSVFSSSFPVHEFKTNLSFSLDGLENGYGNLQPVQDHTTSSRILFPFEELKPVSTSDQFEQDRVQGDSNGYWNGMLGGGSW
ncbi:hypothetical protein Pfo_027904 [Paulownia fortunei]|nr:hypothetical protein Pfo_027904 [Paulownia fortunei]